jgi:hypothetical protein
MTVESLNAICSIVCFGRDWGVTVPKDFLTGKILCRKYIKHKRPVDYRECTDLILSKGYRISGIVRDGELLI